MEFSPLKVQDSALLMYGSFIGDWDVSKTSFVPLTNDGPFLDYGRVLWWTIEFKTEGDTFSKSSFLVPSPNLTYPLKIGLPKRKVVFQPSIFRCYVSFREGIQFVKFCRCYMPFFSCYPMICSPKYFNFRSQEMLTSEGRQPLEEFLKANFLIRKLQKKTLRWTKDIAAMMQQKTPSKNKNIRRIWVRFL